MKLTKQWHLTIYVYTAWTRPAQPVAREQHVARDMLPAETSEITKRISALSLENMRQNAEEILKTYELFTYLLTSLLTPWSRVLLDKLSGLQLVKIFPAFYGTRRFITAFTSASHLSLC